MKSLYLRIWLTVVAALALFALASGWLVQRHLDGERARAEGLLSERMAAWGELIQGSLPTPDASADDQAVALREWSRRLRVPLALDDAQGRRVAASDSFLRREEDGPSQRRALPIRLDDGRVLWLMRPSLARLHRMGPPPELAASGALPDRPPPDGERPPEDDRGPPDEPGRLAGERPPPRNGQPPREPGLYPADDGPPPFGLPPLGIVPRDWPASIGLVLLLALMFLAVAGGAWPVVRSLTRRLERLKHGVEAFGAGALHQRVPTEGTDEVAAVAASFNRAAERIEALVQSNQRLLANASHELRSPLARLKMAVAMIDDAPAASRSALFTEINANIAELDALVEEVLLSSRLEAGVSMDLDEPVDLLGLAAEEGGRVAAAVDGPSLMVRGNERLLRRALRNLLENARRYGGGEIAVEVRMAASGSTAEMRVCDRGTGVPEDQRERIFEPFYRMTGHAEREGGVGLGLALVRQIAERHGGTVRCEARQGGGSCFVLALPVTPLPSASSTAAGSSSTRSAA